VHKILKLLFLEIKYFWLPGWLAGYRVQDVARLEPPTSTELRLNPVYPAPGAWD
jgi:hypothetical protein